MFPNSALDNVALNYVAKDDPGSDVDGVDGFEEATDKDVEEEERETNESADDDENEGVYGNIMVTVQSRMKKLGHNYAIISWICSVHPDVKKDAKARF